MSGKAAHQSAVLDFLVKQNRPFSANDILNNFNGQLTKTNVTNALEQLYSSKKIEEKLYGKQKVFMALQNVNIVSLKQDLRDLEEKKMMAKGELGRLQFDNNRIERELKSFGNQVPLNELIQENQALFGQVEELKERLYTFKTANVELVTKEEKTKLQKERNNIVKLWKKYRRIANEMIATILENCNIKKAVLCDDLGLELDEDAKVKIPEI